MRGLHNSVKKDRCFIIGNGPSLTLEDLNRLKNEDTFACNRIYKLYKNTEWRPTYYVSQDNGVLLEIKEDMDYVIKNSKYVFLNSYIAAFLKRRLTKKDNVLFFKVNSKYDYPNPPGFSMDISKEVCEGFTVAYTCIQMAVFLGYKEIYLIGVDHNYNLNLKADGSVEEKDGVINYMSGLEGKLAFPPQMEKSTLAFEEANRVCKSNGIKIYNATRGGKLEAFPRIYFDEIL